MVIYFLYLIISPLLFVLTHFYKFFNKKLLNHLKNEKYIFKNLLQKIDHTKKLLIFHAASTGEFEQLKPILKKINRNKYYVLQTFTSPTIYEQQKQNQLFDYSCYHPYDFIWKSYYFFKKLKPYKYIITRHDIWPNHILICRLLKIPIYYINANIHKNSIWLKPIIKTLSKFIFPYINYIFVPSSRIQKNIMMFNSNSIITGDSRFDQILERKENHIKPLLPAKYQKTKNIIFGSYDQIDEKMILSALLKSFPGGDKDLIQKSISIFLVPHEINKNHIESLIIKLQKINFNVSLYSNINAKFNVVLVDIVGILADLYQFSRLAYVGGGFTRGVHSVIEPAIYNCLVGFGPNYEMLDEANYMSKNRLSININNQSDLTKFIQLLSNEQKQENIRKLLPQFIKSHAGSSNKIIKKLNL